MRNYGICLILSIIALINLGKLNAMDKTCLDVITKWRTSTTISQDQLKKYRQLLLEDKKVTEDVFKRAISNKDNTFSYGELVIADNKFNVIESTTNNENNVIIYTFLPTRYGKTWEQVDFIGKIAKEDLAKIEGEIK